MVYPLLTPVDMPLDYLLLDEALYDGLIEVGEVSTGGSVPELQVLNKGKKCVLVLDGEELVGAKQNRIVNTTILIAALSKVIIPVSCVEQGRWSYRSERFESKEHMLCSEIRAQKAMHVNYSLKADRGYTSHQGEIWDAIDWKARRRKAESPSMAMSEIYEKDKISLDDYQRKFSPAKRQTGAVFVINGKIAGLDCFACHDIFKKVFTKLVKSYALDAIDWYEPDRAEKSLNGEQVTQFLRNMAGARMERRKSVSEGEDIRIESDSVIGFALENEGRVLHLAAFAKPAGSGRDRDPSRMERFSSRRNHRM